MVQDLHMEYLILQYILKCRIRNYGEIILLLNSRTSIILQLHLCSKNTNPNFSQRKELKNGFK